MFKLLRRFNKREYSMIVISTVFIAAQVWLELKIPDYMTQITNALGTRGSTTMDILKPGSIMLGLSILSMISAVIVGYFAARVAAGFSARLRGNVFNQVMDYSTEDINQFSIPSLLTRSTNDITQIQQFIAMGLQVIIKAPIMAVWAITKIANKGWQWTMATGIAVLLLVVMLTFVLVLVQPRFKIVQRLTDALNQTTRENLSGLRVVHAFNAENFQNKKFDQANDRLTSTNLFANRVLALMNPVMTLISNGLTLAVYAIGAILIENAAMGVGRLTLFSNMIVFSSYAMQVILAFLLLSIIFVILPRVTVSAGRVNNVLAVRPGIHYETKTKAPIRSKGTVEFQDVSFKFKDAEANAIEHLSFKAEPGQTIAFIGSTGSGKSTVLNLLARQADVTSGRILVDGVDIRDYSESDLNNLMGYIPQKAVLFSGTVRSNIDFGENARAKKMTDQTIYAALDIAQARDFIDADERGLDAPVAQHGDNFSGGQKQRLAIARAIARDPEILMFDDSFSALDYATDRQLRDALKKDRRQTTKLIVAQRISTIMDADQIVVLENGRVAGKGTHEALLKNNQVYQEIAYSQLSKEELAE
ncbi:ABC transporter ATP-binding protein [Lentilactobacillus parafarraginis]|uniref:ABC-type multidrug protein lipid transport system, ATPase component n=1 Tax=Lentilactobacillus parafarraginis DSM 18390 = JCM 14109 TaxID=1423786 RepID=A0A0R1YNZ2_9LACO|nr:ABC transporter ATP-binding protein [Lentilactobacillus parafarraginis]KRM44055.1 ABC-type multidrug protein lipid transport system, ATPase component [Lentilactobacillus parafarraginis DSM 18390 = JCM 14109]